MINANKILKTDFRPAQISRLLLRRFEQRLNREKICLRQGFNTLSNLYHYGNAVPALVGRMTVQQHCLMMAALEGEQINGSKRTKETNVGRIKISGTIQNRQKEVTGRIDRYLRLQVGEKSAARMFLNWLRNNTVYLSTVIVASSIVSMAAPLLAICAGLALVICPVGIALLRIKMKLSMQVEAKEEVLNTTNDSIAEALAEKTVLEKDQILALFDAERQLFISSLIEEIEKGKTALMVDYRLQRRQVIKIIRDEIIMVRSGAKKSLVGVIPGLNQKMEEAFSRGMMKIKGPGDYDSEPYIMRRFHNTTFFRGRWEHYLNEPTPDLKKQIYSAYLEWKKTRVEYPDSALDGFLSFVEREYKLGSDIEIVHPHSTGQVICLLELLGVLPRNAFPEAITRIDVYGGSHAVDGGEYKSKDRTVYIYEKEFVPDRITSMATFLHECGHAIRDLLIPEEVDAFKVLHDEFRQKGALFTRELTMEREENRVARQSFFKEFFAENFMHFIILGKRNFIGDGPSTKLRARLYDLYANLYGPAGFDILDHLNSLIESQQR